MVTLLLLGRLVKRLGVGFWDPFAEIIPSNPRTEKEVQKGWFERWGGGDGEVPTSGWWL